MVLGMMDAWDRVDNDDDIRACVLTGAGGAFCSGADLSIINAKPPGDAAKAVAVTMPCE